jgi:ketosteroid isomerase-like protein
MSRRLSIVISVLCLATGVAACAQPPAAQTPADTTADKAKLEADALVWFDHYAKADSGAIANLYAEDALLMPPGAAAVTGRAGIKTFLGEDSAKTQAAGLSLKNKSVTGSGISGDLGWISGTYVVTDKSGTTIDSGSYLSVHRRTNGAWLYIRDIWNSDRPPAPAPQEGSTKTKK